MNNIKELRIIMETVMMNKKIREIGKIAFCNKTDRQDKS
jgi:hypothetical protein